MDTICYLCGKEITVDQKISGDHVVPRLFIDREQPKAKGFDYAGFIHTHETCNNTFGPEDYCRKALKIISKLNDSDCISELQHRKDPALKVMVVNYECFDEFSTKELRFFRIRDVRSNSYSEIQDQKFIQETPPINIKQTVLFTSLAVITKSSAALLIKRFLNNIPTCWKVLAIPYHGITIGLNFDEILGDVKPFDKDVKVYIKDLNAGVYLVLYLVYEIMLYLFFDVSENTKHLMQLPKKFPESSHYYFEGNCINDLLGYQWRSL